jgi:hypothetical protein
LTAVKALQIKALIGMPTKKAKSKPDMNQQLTVAIGLIAKFAANLACFAVQQKFCA